MSELKIIKKTKWILPTQDDGNAFMIRATKAEEHLIKTLYFLEKIRDQIPQTPAQQTKNEIDNYLIRYK